MSLSPLLTQINQDFISLFQETHLDEVLEKLMLQQPLPTTLKKIPNTHGIYLFTIERKLVSSKEELEQLWNEDPQKPQYTPRVIKKNIERCFEKNLSRLPLYLGKSEKLQTRLDNHLNGKFNSKTYSLKLKQRTSLDLTNIQFAYYEIPFEENLCSEIKQLYLTTLEQKLRKKLFPLVGKK